MTAETVVIGGGAIGLALARDLRLRGKSVTMIERDPEGFNASCGNAGGFGVTEVLPLEMTNLLRNLPRWLLDPCDRNCTSAARSGSMKPFRHSGRTRHRAPSGARLASRCRNSAVRRPAR